MQPDVDLIIDLWSRLKPFVPQKERLDAADAIVAVLDEHGYAEGLEGSVDTLDRPLAAAVKSLYGVDDVDDDEDEYDDHDY